MSDENTTNDEHSELESTGLANESEADGLADDLTDDLEEVEPLVFRLQDRLSALVGDQRGLKEDGEPVLPDGSDMLADFVAYKGYEIRESQAEIVDETIEAFFVTKDAEDEEDYDNGFAAGTDVLLNAPVATGKSAAAIFSGLGVQQRIILASSNKSLQQQYIDKDIPEIAEFLKSEYDYDLTYFIMKGQYNYANLVNLRDALEGTSEFEVFAQLTGAERSLIESIVDQSEMALEQVANTGGSKFLDCGDLIAQLPKKMQRLASAASADGKARWLEWAERCGIADANIEYTSEDVISDTESIFNGISQSDFEFITKDSPYSTAYFLAMTADVAVVNQSLLIADLKRTQGMAKYVGPDRAMIYPSLVRGAGFICVDEAQHYPANVTSALSKNFSLSSYADVLERAIRRVAKIGMENTPLIGKYRDMLALVEATHDVVRDSQEKVDDETGEPVVDAEEIVESFRELYDKLCHEFKIVTAMTFNKSSLSKMMASAMSSDKERTISEELSDIAADDVVNNRNSREMKALSRSFKEVNESIIQHLGEFEPDDAWSVTVTSAEQWNPNAKNNEDTNYIVNMTPLDIRSHRAEILQLQQMPNPYALAYGQKNWNGCYGTMMVLMSGTLSRFVGPKIGMSPDNYVSVDSPMDARRTRLCVPDDLPAPSGRDYMKWVAASTDRVVEMVKQTRGRTMVLCTSNNTMNEYAAALRKKVPSVRVIAQNDMDKKAAIELFKLEEHAVLLGMKSFWEGVDIPGDDLLLVIMDKIMFPIQDDPIYGALSESEDMNGGDAFLNVTVDHAAFMFAQGAGRLQRSESDFGGILLLDPRINTARYGSRILSLAPEKLPFTNNYSRFKKYMERVRASVDDGGDRPKPPKITDDAQNWTSIKNCGVKGANRKRRSTNSDGGRRRF